MKKILIFIICMFFLTGCYNYIELEKLGVASSFYIDYDEVYKITVEIYDEKKTKTFYGEGSSIANTLENIMKTSEKKLFYSHLNTVIITKNIDLDKIIHYFLNEPSVNSAFYLVQSDEKLNYDEEINLGKKIFYILKNANQKNFYDVTEDYINNELDTVLPLINKDGNFYGKRIYKDNKIVFDINEEEINTLNILNGQTEIFIKIPCDNEYFVTEINSNKIKYHLNNKIMIDLNLELTLGEYNCKKDTMKEKDILKLEEYVNNEISNKAYDLINKMNDKKVDILGINNRLFNKYHKLDKLSYQYKYDIKVDANINKKGLLLK